MMVCCVAGGKNYGSYGSKCLAFLIQIPTCPTPWKQMLAAITTGLMERYPRCQKGAGLTLMHIFHFNNLFLGNDPQ
jgi:hypothetical protein